MERILYFDCFAGISGDMTIGALIDLGLDPAAVVAEIGKLGVKGYDIDIRKISRYSIGGTDVKVTLTGNAGYVREDNAGLDPDHKHDHNHAHDYGHEHDDNNHEHDDHNDGYDGHDHGHMHNNEHDHGHTHDHEHNHSHHHHEKERSLADISLIIRNSGISEKAKQLSVAIFTEIANAEASVHNKSIEEVHFHEVGAVDSIVDIVGTAICLDMLKIDRIFCSPVHEGQGFINCRHGILPVPVPAVIKMLGGSGISIVTEDIQAELVTPTGFGILKTVSEGCCKMPEMLVECVGYGFGKTETGRLNALRVILGTLCDTGQIKSPIQDNIADDAVVLLETNIDDTTGEILGYTMERLMKAGALDVYYTPIQMKKNRPASMLSVICREQDKEKLSEIIFMETSTIGIRAQDIQRITLKREIRAVKTDLGEVRVKLFVVRGLERIQPEYEDCRKIAKENDLSLNEVYEIVKRCHYGEKFSKDL